MTPTLRLMWMLVRSPGLLLMLILALQIAAVTASLNRQLFLMTLLSLAGDGVLLAWRFKQIAASRTWNWLPGGQRVLTRALAFIVLFAVSVIALFTCWAQARGVVELPVRNLPLAFGALAGVVFMVFAHRLPAIQPRVTRAFIVTLTLLLADAIFGEPVRGLSWVTAVTIGALWLVVIGTAGTPAPEGWFSRLSRTLQGVAAWSTPARRILQADKPFKDAFPIALVGTLSIVFFIRDLLDLHARDTLSALLAGVAGFLAAAILIMAMAAARRARMLWMRCGDSRSQVMRVCEQALFVNILVLTAICWLGATGFAVLVSASFRMLPRALAAFPVLVVAALPALYLGLAWPTFAKWWRDMPRGHIVFAAILLLPVVWRAAYAVVQPQELKPAVLPVLIAIAAALLLRGFAVWRWRRIDWAYLKAETT